MPSKLRPVLINVAVLVATLVVLLLVVEATLRLTGFRYVLKPEDIQFGRPEPMLLKTGFLEDDDLFWVRRDYFDRLAQFQRDQPPLALLGDSCTHLGQWDRALAARFRQRTGQDLRWANLATAGWSSYQGLRQAERDLPALHPQVATVYFGWNDHWVGFGIEDKNVAAVRKTFRSRYAGIRLVQLLTKARIAWGIRDTDFPQRVSPDDYRANLRGTVRAIRAAGAQPLLITAGSNHVAGREPPELGERWLLDVDELIPLHQRYVAITREVAAEEKAALCDLAANFAALPQDERDRLFAQDGIHLQEEGDARIAEWVDACFEREGFWPLLETPKAP